MTSQLTEWMPSGTCVWTRPYEPTEAYNQGDISFCPCSLWLSIQHWGVSERPLQYESHTHEKVAEADSGGSIIVDSNLTAMDLDVGEGDDRSSLVRSVQISRVHNWVV